MKSVGVLLAAHSPPLLLLLSGNFVKTWKVQVLYLCIIQISLICMLFCFKRLVCGHLGVTQNAMNSQSGRHGPSRG